MLAFLAVSATVLLLVAVSAAAALALLVLALAAQGRGGPEPSRDEVLLLAVQGDQVARGALPVRFLQQQAAIAFAFPRLTVSVAVVGGCTQVFLLENGSLGAGAPKSSARGFLHLQTLGGKCWGGTCRSLRLILYY